MQDILESGVKLFYYYTDEEVKIDGAVDKFMGAARSFAAELEREKTSQRTHERLMTKARRGLVVGGRVYGYDNVEVKEGDRRVRVEYKVNEKEAEIVREIFRRYAEGEGLRGIAKDLNARRVAPPRAGKRGTGSWSYSSIYAIVRWARGIPVCGTRAVGMPTAELAWGLILALVKRIPMEDRALRAGAWQTGLTEGLAGKRLGVVGLGKLGTQVSRVGQAFGMDVGAWSPNLDDVRAEEACVKRVDKRDLFTTSDIVSVHLVLSERTRGIVSAEEVNAMKPSAWFVNTSRAGLVDMEALLQALRERRIAGAGLDVFPVEPIPADDPLLALPNVVLTPHLGYVTRENFAMYYQDALEDILSWHAGAPLRLLT